MGNIFQITCDGAFFNRCLDCFLGKVANTSKLQDNLVALETELGKLIAAKNDVMMRVVNAERQQLRTLDQVQVWLSRVEAVETEADELKRHGSQEIDKLCVGGYCSKNCASSYKFGKQVAKKLRDVQTLIDEGVPTCPHLLTLFLDFNYKLEMMTDGFFQCMPSLKVLKMSNCGHVKVLKLPFGMSKLGSLQLLDISHTGIRELPEELKLLVNLKCLNLRWTHMLNKIPRQLISNSSWLRVLRMFAIGFENSKEPSEDSVLIGGGEVLVHELLGLKYLEVLELTLRSYDALQFFLSSNKLKSCIRSLFLIKLGDTKSIHATAFADLKHLNELCIRSAVELEELKVDYTEIAPKRSEPFVFRSLHRVTMERCHKLKDLTFLVFAPSLKSLSLYGCNAMEEIISVGKFDETPEVMGHISPFGNLQTLYLTDLPELKSIYWKPLPFTHLKEMTVHGCNQLKKLPLDSNSATERKFVIRGYTHWWNRLQWEDEATQIAFRFLFGVFITVHQKSEHLDAAQGSLINSWKQLRRRSLLFTKRCSICHSS
ncbi:hypothetical protein CUMW_260120 [Citrus unshiu]|uniref:Disease resistance protein At4g27190-like leucine-rich repeats domain-containing protein n=1 Tax=Citrus unshiu TaxID=55188 RepID=A0A2H5QTG2_CITUN|nr:hypothetical protein CUMW_260120 [Citrus unshiu]